MPFVVLSSADRDVGSNSDTNFMITTSQTFADFKYCRLSKFVITNTLYNVTDGENTFTFIVADDDSGTNQVTCSITVPPGYYQITDMITVLNTLCSAEVIAQGQTGAVTWTNGLLTSKFTVAISLSKYIGIAADQGLGLNLQLGFSRYTDIALTLSSVVAPRVYNLTKYNLLLLNTNVVTANSYNSNSSSRVSMLDMIPIAGSSFGSILTYIPPNNDWIKLSEASLSSIFINVTDEHGDAIDLNGGFCEIILEIHA